MGTRKKASELVFNLQWRNKPDNGGDKSNIIGIYDTPAATDSFDTFKSYLLKNSGVAGNDVKVTYVADSGLEWVIDSPEWFEFALGAFRLKARLGEVIYLKLDKISGSNMSRKHSNDVETQFDVDSVGCSSQAPPDWFLNYMTQFKRDVVEDVIYAVSAIQHPNSKEKETAVPIPAILKKNKCGGEFSKRNRKHLIVGDIQIDKEFLRSKFERKLEHKLEKLDAKTKKIKEKRQAVLSKIDREDRFDCEQTPLLNTSPNGKPLLNGGSKSPNSAVIPHMLGGEAYLHTWVIENNGLLAWTSNTEIRLTWGSAEMVPSSRSIACPALKPGESDTISVRFLIPSKPGQYESYWNFYDGDERFGHWLCCRIVVDVPLGHLNTFKKLKFDQERNENDFPNLEEAPKPQRYTVLEPHLPKPVVVNEYAKLNTPEPRFCNYLVLDSTEALEEVPTRNSETPKNVEEDVVCLTGKMQECKIMPLTVDSDSDWESLRSYGKPKNVSDKESSSSNKYGINENELVVDLSRSKKESGIAALQENVEILKEELGKRDVNDNNNNGNLLNNNSSGESISEIASEASDLSSGYDVLTAPICEEKDDSGYVYITIDGNKLSVPKHILRPDVLAQAEEAPAPTPSLEVNPPKEENAAGPSSIAAKLETEILELEQNLKDTKSFISHCSASGSCFSDADANNRLFIFPQTNPGFEVVYPSLPSELEQDSCCQYTSAEMPLDGTQVYTWAQSPTQYNLVSATTTSPYGPLDQSGGAAAAAAAAPAPAEQKFEHVPNYQQTPKTETPSPTKVQSPTPTAPPQPAPSQGQSVPVHILPENLVSGAVNVASSAINTARSVINMIVPPKSESGRWVNGHWVTQNPESIRSRNLVTLSDMGFWNPDLNATLLARYNDDIQRVITELLNMQ